MRSVVLSKEVGTEGGCGSEFVGTAVDPKKDRVALARNRLKFSFHSSINTTDAWWGDNVEIEAVLAGACKRDRMRDAAIGVGCGVERAIPFLRT